MARALCVRNATSGPASQRLMKGGNRRARGLVVDLRPLCSATILGTIHRMKLAWHAVAILALGAGLSHAQPVTIVNDVGDVPPGYCEAQPPATCYYVDPVNGDDGAPGSFAQPWRTMVNFNESIYQGFRPPTWVGLSPGDVVYLMEGVHNTIYHPGGDGRPPHPGSQLPRSPRDSRSGSAGRGGRRPL